MKQYNKIVSRSLQEEMSRYYDKDPRLESFAESYLFNEDIKSFLHDTKETIKGKIKNFDDKFKISERYRKLMYDPAVLNGIYAFSKFTKNTTDMLAGFPSPAFLVQGAGTKMAASASFSLLNAVGNKDVQDIIKALYYIKKSYGLSIPKLSARSTKQEATQVLYEYVQNAKNVIGDDPRGRNAVALIVTLARKFGKKTRGPSVKVYDRPQVEEYPEPTIAQTSKKTPKPKAPITRNQAKKRIAKQVASTIKTRGKQNTKKRRGEAR